MQSNFGGIKSKIRESLTSEAKLMAKKQIRKQSKKKGKDDDGEDDTDSEEEDEEDVVSEGEELNLSDDEEEVHNLLECLHFEHVTSSNLI